MENQLGQEPKNQPDKLFDRKFLIYFTSGLFVIVTIFIVSAFFFRNFDQYSFWPNVVGAAVGVILTAMVTGLLLWGQTKAEEAIRKKQREADQASERATREFQEKQKIQDRNFQVELNQQQSNFQKQLLAKDNEEKRYLEIHNAKLKVYSDFVSKMYNILRDNKIDQDEMLDLRTQIFGQVSFYADGDILESINNELKAIENYGDTGKMQRRFANIACILQKDLRKDWPVNEQSAYKLWDTFDRLLDNSVTSANENTNSKNEAEAEVLVNNSVSPICINVLTTLSGILQCGEANNSKL